jgi:hypothetical protein
LKQNLEGLIEPRELIPSSKLEAVRRLGFEAFHKVFLTYEEPFWAEDFQGLHFVQLPEPGQSVLLMNSRDKSWRECLCSMTPVFGHKRTLCAYISDNEEIELFDDEFVKTELTELMRRFLKTRDLPAPKEIKRYDRLAIDYVFVFVNLTGGLCRFFFQRSSWKTNPLFNGVYSFLPFGSLPSDFDALAEPIAINEGKNVGLYKYFL